MDLILGTTPTKEDYMKCLARADVSGSFENMLSESIVSKTLDSHTESIGKKIAYDTMNGGVKQLPFFNAAVEQATAEFRDWFREIHKEIIPMSEAELKDICKAKKIGFNTLYSHNLCMVVNACMAKDCPFFLEVKGRLSHHMDI